MSKKIQIDGKDLEIESLSKKAKETLLSIQFAENKMMELKNLNAIFQRAKNSYVNSLKKEMITKIGWLDFLGKCVYEWIKLDTDQKITKFNLLDSWVVRQFKDQFNPTHWHYGHISGAGFLKVPKSLGKFSQTKPSNTYRGGHLEFLHGSRMFLNKSVYHAVPKVGDFYIFPNYLMHHVWPFKDTDDERRSISFNAEIDEKIYNVYSR